MYTKYSRLFLRGRLERSLCVNGTFSRVQRYWWTEGIVGYQVKGLQGKTKGPGYVIFSLAILALFKKEGKNKAQARSEIRSRWLHPRHIQGQTCLGPKINLSGPIRTFELRLKVI